MTSFDLYLIIAWTGYALAIWLYYGLGKIFWVPIALDLVYDILGAKFNIWGDNVETLVIVTAYNVLLLLWVLFMSGLMKSKWSTLIAFGLVMVASFTGMASTAVYQNIGVERFAEFVGLPGFHRKWILLSILTWYTWSTVTFVVILAVTVNGTFFRWLRGRSSNIITNPRFRVLIPIGLYTAIIGLSQLYQGIVPEGVYSIRFRIAGTALGWGWVALELPFFIMYRRMLRAER